MSAVIKMKVVEVKPLESGAFSNKLNHRTDEVIKDDLLGDVIDTKSEYYYVKTVKGLKLDSELDVDMSKYVVEESEFKNTDEKSAYYGETMKSKWLLPKR